MEWRSCGCLCDCFGALGGLAGVWVGNGREGERERVCVYVDGVGVGVGVGAISFKISQNIFLATYISHSLYTFILTD